MNLCGKTLEPTICIELIHRHVRLIFDKSFVLSKPHIDKPSLISQGLLYIWPDKVTIVFDTIHLPDDIVTLLQITKDLV